MEHHRTFKTNYRVGKGDWGIDIHELGMRAANHAVVYDGLDISNLASFEDLFRQVQLVEYVYYQEADNSKGKGQGKGNRDVMPEEAAVFAGTHRDYGEAMVCPELLDYVSKEVERDASIMKQVRKAREEKKLLKKGNTNTGGE